jgi:hypothetical protein
VEATEGAATGGDGYGGAADGATRVAAEAEVEMKKILEGRNRPTGRQELIHLPLYILFFVIIMVRLNCHFGSRESKHSEITRSCSHLPTVG